MEYNIKYTNSYYIQINCSYNSININYLRMEQFVFFVTIFISLTQIYAQEKSLKEKAKDEFKIRII